MDAVAPGLLLAQAIGRWGNWWNQELFGKPTDLPWGLEIDAEQPPGAVPRRRRPSTRRSSTSSSTTLLGAAVLICVGRRFRIRPPALFALYVVVLHVRALLRGAAAGRSRARARPAPPERLGVDRRVRRLDGVLRLVAVPAAAEARSRAARPSAAEGRRRWPSRRAASGPPASVRRAMVVRELELDLDAFEGPFDLLLTLVLKRGARAGRGRRRRRSCSRSSSGWPSATSSTSRRAASSSCSSRRCSS